MTNDNTKPTVSSRPTAMSRIKTFFHKSSQKSSSQQQQPSLNRQSSLLSQQLEDDENTESSQLSSRASVSGGGNLSSRQEDNYPTPYGSFTIASSVVANDGSGSFLLGQSAPSSSIIQPETKTPLNIPTTPEEEVHHFTGRNHHHRELTANSDENLSSKSLTHYMEEKPDIDSELKRSQIEDPDVSKPVNLLSPPSLITSNTLNSPGIRALSPGATGSITSRSNSSQVSNSTNKDPVLTSSQHNQVPSDVSSQTSDSTAPVNTVIEETLSIEDVYFNQALQNNPTISMNGYAEAFDSFQKDNSISVKPVFGLQALPNIYQPTSFFEGESSSPSHAISSDNASESFNTIPENKPPIMSFLYEYQIDSLPLHARKTIYDRMQSKFLVLISNTKKQNYFSKISLRKLQLPQTKKHIIEETKLRIYDEFLFTKEIRFSNDPESSPSQVSNNSPPLLTDYVFPKFDKSKRASSGSANLKVLSDLEKHKSMSPTSSTPLSTSPLLSSSVEERFHVRKTSQDYSTGRSRRDSTDSSSSSLRESQDEGSSSDELEDNLLFPNFNPTIAEEIPNGFLSTKIEPLKDFLQETYHDNSMTNSQKKPIMPPDFKIWRKEHLILDVLTDELINTQEWKQKYFPYMFPSSEPIQDGSTDLLLQHFHMRKQDVDNRVKMVLEIDGVKLDFIEEAYSGVSMENLYGTATLYSVGESGDGSHLIKRQGETFSFTLANTVGKKRALFYLNPKGLPKLTGQAPSGEKTFLLFRLFRSFKGNYSEHFNELYLKGGKAKSNSNDKTTVNDSKEMKAIKSVKGPFFENLKDIHAPLAWSIVEMDSILSQLPAVAFPSLYVNGDGLSSSFSTKNMYLIPARAVGNVVDEKLFEIYFSNNLHQTSNVLSGNERTSTDLAFTHPVPGDKLVGGSTSSNREVIRQLSKTMLKPIPGFMVFKVSLFLPTKLNQPAANRRPSTFSIFGKDKQFEFVQRKYLPEGNILVLQPDVSGEVTEKKSKRRDIPKEEVESNIPVSEMEQFYFSKNKNDDISRHNNLRNELYIYPQSANFSKFASKHKNIQLTVSLYDNDNNFSLNNMEQKKKNLFYKPFSGNSILGLNFEGESICVSLKNEKPEFCDEIKCKIPCEDANNRHLVFKFYNVMHKEPKKTNDTEQGVSKTLLGVAFLRVYKIINSNIDKKTVLLKDLISGEFELPVYPVLNVPNSNYLRLIEDNVDPSLSHIKPTANFKVRVMPYSFIYPNLGVSMMNVSKSSNLFLLKYFRLVNNYQNETIPPLEEVIDCGRTLIQTYELEKQADSQNMWFDLHSFYLPMVLNSCFEWILNSTRVEKSVSQYQAEIWKIILFFIEKFNQHSVNTATILKIYQKYQFTLFYDKKFHRTELVSKLMLSLIDAIQSEGIKSQSKQSKINVIEELFLRNNHTVLGILLKCIVFSMNESVLHPFETTYSFNNSHLRTKGFLSGFESFVTSILEMVESIAGKTDKHPTLRTFMKNLATFFVHVISIYNANTRNNEDIRCNLDAKQEVLQVILRFIESIGYVPSLIKTRSSDIQTLGSPSDIKKTRELVEVVTELQLIMTSEILLNFTSFEFTLPPTIDDIYSNLGMKNPSPVSILGDIRHHYVFSAFLEQVMRSIYASEEREPRIKTVVLLKEYVEKVSRETSSLVMFSGDENNHPANKENLRARVFTSQFLLEAFTKYLMDTFPEWRRNVDSNHKKIAKSLEEIKRKVLQVERDIATVKENANNQNTKQKSTMGDKRLGQLEAQQTTLRQLLSTKEKQLLDEIESSKNEKRMFLSLFVHVLNNSEENVLRTLWKVNTTTERNDLSINPEAAQLIGSKLLIAFQMCLQSFEYTGFVALYHYYERMYQKQASTTHIDQSNNSLPKGILSQTISSIAGSSMDSKPANWRNTLSFNMFKPAKGQKTNPGDDRLTNSKTSLDGKDDASVSMEFNDSPKHSTQFATGSSKDDFIQRKIQLERQLSQEVGFSVFQLFLKFMDDNAPYIQTVFPVGSPIDVKHLPPIIENIIRTLLNFLHSNLSENLTITVLIYLRNILSQYPFTAIFYNPQSEYGLLFAEELLRLSHSRLGSVRKHASACFYLWIRFCFEENRGMTIPQVMATMALSKTLQQYTNINNLHHLLSSEDGSSNDDGSYDDPDGIPFLEFIEECIKMLPYFAVKDDAAPGSKFFKIRTKYGRLKGQGDMDNPNTPLEKIEKSNKEEVQESLTNKQKGDNRFHNAMLFFKKIENKADQKKYGQKVLEIMDQFHELITTLSKKLLSLVQDSMAIRATMIKRRSSGDTCTEIMNITYDPFKTEELLYRISDNYSKLPELRLAWMEQLATYHRRLFQYDESAHCYLRILSLTFDYLEQQTMSQNRRLATRGESASSLLDILPISQFYTLSPMLLDFKANQTAVQTQSILGNANMSLSDYLSDRGIVQYILKAIDSLELAECYEYCILLYKMIIPIFELKYADFSQLHTIYERLTQLYKKCSAFQTPSSTPMLGSSKSIDMENMTLGFQVPSTLSALMQKPDTSEADSRVYSFYYRVKFVGKAFGELNGKIYIYKMPKLFKLFKMKNRMLEIYGKDVEVVSKDDAATSNNDDDFSNLVDSQRKIIQINHVKPFLPTPEQVKILKKKFDDLNRINSSSNNVNSAPSWRGHERSHTVSHTERMDYKSVLKRSPRVSSASKIPSKKEEANLFGNSEAAKSPRLRSYTTLITQNSPSKSLESPHVDTAISSPSTPIKTAPEDTNRTHTPGGTKISVPKLNLSKPSIEANSKNITSATGNAFNEIERFLYDKVLSLTYFIPRDTEFHRNMNLNQFFYEYSISTSKNADISQTYKKKIVITTDGYFPNVMTRLPILEEQEFTLTPLENSIEMINQQIKKLEGAMNLILGTAVGDISNYTTLGNLFSHSVQSSHSHQPLTMNPNNSNLMAGVRQSVTTNTIINLNVSSNLGNLPYLNDLNITPHTLSNLQMILQGSVQARVGEGPKKVVEQFLNKENREQCKMKNTNNSNDLLEKLNERCFRFLLLCERAVKLHSIMIHTQASTSNNKERILHTELEKGFVEVKELFQNYLVLPKIKTIPSNQSSTTNTILSARERANTLKNLKVNIQDSPTDTFVDITLDEALDAPDLFYKHNNLPSSLVLSIANKFSNSSSQQFNQQSEPSVLPNVRNANRLSIPSNKMKEYLEQLSIPGARSTFDTFSFEDDKYVNDLLTRMPTAEM